MTWDGAYQFARSLMEQRAYAFEGRFHSYFLWQPFVLLSRFTSDYTTLLMAYGLPFTLAPAAGLLGSWWVVRREAPHLVVWAVFGVAVAPLPGQIFVINDSIWQQHLFWPVYLGLFVALTRPQAVALSILALFQLCHPVGIVLLSGGAVAAGLAAVFNRERRRRLVVNAGLMSALGLVAVVKLALWPDPYASQEATWANAVQRWRFGVLGLPLAGMVFMWTAGVLTLAARHVPTTVVARSVRWGALACAAAGGVLWVAWASDEHRWAWAVEYRRWVVPLAVPFYALVLIEVCRRAPRTNPDRSWQLRGPLASLLACTFAAVLGIQSAIWAALTDRLMAGVARHPAAVVPRAAVPWVADTPMDHWGTAAYVVALQGKRPRKLLLMNESTRAALTNDPPAVPWVEIDPRPPGPGPGGWYDFRPILNELRHSDPPG